MRHVAFGFTFHCFLYAILKCLQWYSPGKCNVNRALFSLICVVISDSFLFCVICVISCVIFLPWRTDFWSCITQPFLEVSVLFQRYLRILHGLTILRWKNVDVTIQKIRISITIPVTVNSTLLPFTESRAYNSEKLYLKSHLDWLNGKFNEIASISKVFL